MPATLSPEILTGILRDSLGFKGIVVTDALDMGALVSTYGAGEAAVRAFLAGTDLLLMPADPARRRSTPWWRRFAPAESPEPGSTRSVRRVLEIKERLGLFRRRHREPGQARRHRRAAGPPGQRAVDVERAAGAGAGQPRHCWTASAPDRGGSPS